MSFFSDQNQSGDLARRGTSGVRRLKAISGRGDVRSAKAADDEGREVPRATAR
jgi:hypothetical protein